MNIKTNNKNKNKLGNDFYLQDKKYLENVLNNNKKKFMIDDILLEKSKKILEEKKLRKEKNNNKEKKKEKNKNENKILSSIKLNLIEKNKKNKYVINPNNLNFFKS